MGEKISYEAETRHQEEELLLAPGEKVQARPETISEAAVEKSAVQSLAEAHAAVHEAEPVSGQTEALKQLAQAENESDDAMAHVVSHDALTISKTRTLKNLQRQEKLPARSFSRLIHAPVIRATSELTAKTVTRPSAMLGGGLAALLGSGSYLVLAKYIGFTYNYSLSLALFVGGFVFGLALEWIVHLATASRRQLN